MWNGHEWQKSSVQRSKKILGHGLGFDSGLTLHRVSLVWSLMSVETKRFFCMFACLYLLSESSVMEWHGVYGWRGRSPAVLESIFQQFCVFSFLANVWIPVLKGHEPTLKWQLNWSQVDSQVLKKLRDTFLQQKKNQKRNVFTVKHVSWSCPVFIFRCMCWCWLCICTSKSGLFVFV